MSFFGVVLGVKKGTEEGAALAWTALVDFCGEGSAIVHGLFRLFRVAAMMRAISARATTESSILVMVPRYSPGCEATRT